MTTTTTNRYEVTEVQLDRCHRIYNENTRAYFYHVESATEPFELYVVQYDQVRKCITCTCKAGQQGFRYAPNKCWHVRASIAHAKEIRAARNAEAYNAMVTFSHEIEEEGFTALVDETSSSLDGLTWEKAPSGRMVPMR